MPSSKYHQEQAKILAGLALSTKDPSKANQFKLAAMQQLERAEAVGSAAEIRMVPAPGATDVNADA
jgi:hypothetical protein